MLSAIAGQAPKIIEAFTGACARTRSEASSGQPISPCDPAPVLLIAILSSVGARGASPTSFSQSTGQLEAYNVGLWKSVVLFRCLDKKHRAQFQQGFGILHSSSRNRFCDSQFYKIRLGISDSSGVIMHCVCSNYARLERAEEWCYVNQLQPEASHELRHSASPNSGILLRSLNCQDCEPSLDPRPE